MAAVPPNWRHLYIVGLRTGETGKSINTPRLVGRAALPFRGSHGMHRRPWRTDHARHAGHA